MGNNQDIMLDVVTTRKGPSKRGGDGDAVT